MSFSDLPLGPLELRAQYSFYGQFSADFYRSEGGGRTDFFTDTPIYGAGAVMRNGEPVFTSDVKMGSFTSHTIELTLTFEKAGESDAAKPGLGLGMEPAVEFHVGDVRDGKAQGFHRNGRLQKFRRGQRRGAVLRHAGAPRGQQAGVHHGREGAAMG